MDVHPARESQTITGFSLARGLDGSLNELNKYAVIMHCLEQSTILTLVDAKPPAASVPN
jgi:hypothetical protein